MHDSEAAPEIECAATGQEAFDKLASRPFDLVLLDYRLPDMDGIEFMRTFRARAYSTPVIFVTTAESVSLAVEAMKLGAEDFVQKQEGYLDLLPLVVREALDRQKLRHEKVRLEAQLRQSEKLASLGILAAGLAHNINNRLTSLKTYFELAPHNESDPLHSNFLDVCRQDLDKIVLLVRELTRYALSEDGPRPSQSLAELVHRAIGHLDDEFLKKQVVVQTDFREVPPLPIDPEGVKQLFINLLKNAVQASPVGSEIRVSIGPEGDAVVARIADQGPGLAPELRERIFDPFFTTKDHGLGIGLYICHKIAALHKGRIEVDNAPGGGAVFTVRLPMRRLENGRPRSYATGEPPGEITADRQPS